MGRALTLVILVVAIGPATSTGQGSESSWAALVGYLFGLEPAVMSVDGLSDAERTRVEEYDRCVQRFASRIQVEGMSQGPLSWQAEARQRVERGIVCLVGGAGIEELAASYARDAELFFEWEGMSDGPLAEAAHAEGYLRTHHETPLAPYLHLFIAHRDRCAAEALAAEGDGDRMGPTTEAYRRHLEAVRSDADPLVRLVAAALAGLHHVYLEPLPPAQPSAAPPPVSLRQALDRAEGWVRDHDLDTSGQFLHGVTLRHDEDPAHRGSYWLVQWSWIQPRLGGEVSIRVDMDGTVTARRLGP